MTHILGGNSGTTSQLPIGTGGRLMYDVAFIPYPSLHPVIINSKDYINVNVSRVNSQNYLAILTPIHVGDLGSHLQMSLNICLFFSLTALDVMNQSVMISLPNYLPGYFRKSFHIETQFLC